MENPVCASWRSPSDYNQLSHGSACLVEGSFWVVAAFEDSQLVAIQPPWGGPLFFCGNEASFLVTEEGVYEQKEAIIENKLTENKKKLS